ncbi:MAG: hypothetical protein KHX99_06655, partial [Atopobium sp.]|nr:hypothetical protein [Atopobium sp.]
NTDSLHLSGTRGASAEKPAQLAARLTAEKPAQLAWRTCRETFAARGPSARTKRARMPRNSIRALVCLDGGEGRC